MPTTQTSTNQQRRQHRADPTKLLYDIVKANPDISRREASQRMWSIMNSPGGEDYQQAIYDDWFPPVWNRITKRLRPMTAAERRQREAEQAKADAEVQRVFGAYERAVQRSLLRVTMTNGKQWGWCTGNECGLLVNDHRQYGKVNEVLTARLKPNQQVRSMFNEEQLSQLFFEVAT